MKLILISLFITLNVCAFTQTVIEMTHPGDANLILLEVDNIEDADIAVLKTDDKEQYQAWDCMWKFKTWGFSNFSVYITNDTKDPNLFDEETGIQHVFHGKIYFTDKIEEKGYKTEGFMLEGVFKIAENKEDHKDKKDKN